MRLCGNKFELNRVGQSSWFNSAGRIFSGAGWLLGAAIAGSGIGGLVVAF